MTQQKFWHRLSNIDSVLLTADCSICGRIGIYKVSQSRYECSRINKARNKKWRKDNPIASNLANHRQHLKSRYGISEQDFLDLLKSQDNKCAICGKDTSYFKNRLHVDHDHACCRVAANSCGKCIRGLVCYHCNIFLGDIESGLFLKALTYLAKKEIK